MEAFLRRASATETGSSSTIWRRSTRGGVGPILPPLPALPPVQTGVYEKVDAWQFGKARPFLDWPGTETAERYLMELHLRRVSWLKQAKAAEEGTKFGVQGAGSKSKKKRKGGKSVSAADMKKETEKIEVGIQELVIHVHDGALEQDEDAAPRRPSWPGRVPWHRCSENGGDT